MTRSRRQLNCRRSTFGDRKLPDKAIDVIDETGASQMLLPASRRKKTIGVKEVESHNRHHGADSAQDRFPRTTRGGAGQIWRPRSASASCSVNRTSRLMHCRPPSNWRVPACVSLKSPSAAYLFSGPTGVGKTEVARQLANRSLGVELLRFDMSEYMERHTVSRLIGAPPGYVGFDQGGLLTDGIDQHPHSRAAARRDREGPSRPVQHSACR